MGRYIPYVKGLFVTVILLGVSIGLTRSFLPGAKGLPLTAGLGGMLSGGGEGEAIEIATECITRIYSLQTRGPSGAESLGRTADERFWMIRLDLGPNRSSILCVVEPDAAEDARRLVHFAVSTAGVTKAFVVQVANRGLWKASVTDAHWQWDEGALTPTPEPSSLAASVAG